MSKALDRRHRPDKPASALVHYIDKGTHKRGYRRRGRHRPKTQPLLQRPSGMSEPEQEASNEQ